MAKVKTVGTIGEFMAGSKPKARPKLNYVAAGGVALAIGVPSQAYAGPVSGVVTEKVVTAFSPLVDLVTALSYPIGLVMMLGGGLFVMVGNSERGFGMIQKAGLGYVLIQMLPLLMDLLVDITKSF